MTSKPTTTTAAHTWKMQAVTQHRLGHLAVLRHHSCQNGASISHMLYSVGRSTVQFKAPREGLRSPVHPHRSHQPRSIGASHVCHQVVAYVHRLQQRVSQLKKVDRFPLQQPMCSYNWGGGGGFSPLSRTFLIAVMNISACVAKPVSHNLAGSTNDGFSRLSHACALLAALSPICATLKLLIANYAISAPSVK